MSTPTPPSFGPELFRLDGRMAIITGGAGALGGMVARGFVAAGAAVVLADPDPAFEKKIRAYNVEFAERWPQRFDYVVYYHFGGKPNFDPARLTLIEQGSFYSILKTKRAKPAL